MADVLLLLMQGSLTSQRDLVPSPTLTSCSSAGSFPSSKRHSKKRTMSASMRLFGVVWGLLDSPRTTLAAVLQVYVRCTTSTSSDNSIVAEIFVLLTRALKEVKQGKLLNIGGFWHGEVALLMICGHLFYTQQRKLLLALQNHMERGTTASSVKRTATPTFFSR